MKWTLKAPKKSGYYWMRSSGMESIVYVRKDQDEWRLDVPGNDDTIFVSDYEDARWAGPIPEPEEDR